MDSLLELARPARRRRKAVSIRALVEDTVASAALALQSSGVELETKLAAGGGLVEGDPVALGRALQNLVDNALQHTPRGGRVCISLRPRAGHVVLKVEDTGPGFAPDELERAFEPFFSRRRGGAGLGLAIVRKVVAEHNGEIEVRNRPQEGAEAVMKLPASALGE